ncbi:hypothetical protein [Sphingobacterium corticibacterium]|uniref:Uncharacterized protein n=1 Tax=Sphingobacterium corticibacterium TaxID=2484746 RepID=A0A4Q6XGB5_9SPHI|nr:hypothetical protein [Sphingobacterium corticibacterium]RZF58940.1 hypothetical protein EWE74_16610 [Sphingobacterium corticibacterium]
MVFDNYLKKYHNDLVGFWLHDEQIPNRPIQDFCDMIYSLHLIGRLNEIKIESCNAFVEELERYDLPGWQSLEVTDKKEKLSVHNFAYLLGTLNIIKLYNIDLYPRLFVKRKLNIGELIDEKKFLPKYPAWLSHHNWRVSHWIGGIPSILFSLGDSSLEQAGYFRSTAKSVLKVINTQLLSQSTGLIKLYKIELFQQIFKKFYKLRHDPELGDLGGVAHILWINHFTDQKYVGNDWLLNESIRLFKKHTPFMEKVPYCLDFDIVQIARTAFANDSKIDLNGLKDRATQMMDDIESFYKNANLEGYTLHKVPGALATYHECALILEKDKLENLEMKTIDIIKDAYWL